MARRDGPVTRPAICASVAFVFDALLITASCACHPPHCAGYFNIYILNIKASLFMKKFLFAVALAIAPLLSFAQLKSATLTASGLTCSMCSKAIFKALSKVSSVARVDADIEGSKYRITFREGAPVVLDDLKKAVTGAGFSVASLEVTGIFPSTAIANDTHLEWGGATYHFLNVPKGTISGEQTLRVVDKAFLPDAEYHRYAQYTKMKCVETGRTAACCTQGGSIGKRVYHVTL